MEVLRGQRMDDEFSEALRGTLCAREVLGWHARLLNQDLMRSEFEPCGGPIGNSRASENAIALQPTLRVVQAQADHRWTPVDIEDN